MYPQQVAEEGEKKKKKKKKKEETKKKKDVQYSEVSKAADDVSTSP